MRKSGLGACESVFQRAIAINASLPTQCINGRPAVSGSLLCLADTLIERKYPVAMRYSIEALQVSARSAGRRQSVRLYRDAECTQVRKAVTGPG